MKLIASPTSPYSRAVRVIAAIRDVPLDIIVANPFDDPAVLLSASAVGKVPTLIDGEQVIADSRVIAAHLWPGDSISEQTRTAAAVAIMDAALALRLEQLRPSGVFSQSHADRHIQRLHRVIGSVQVRDAFGVSDVFLAVALEYVDFRHPELDWRAGQPELAAWAASVAQRPAMRATAFA